MEMIFIDLVFFWFFSIMLLFMVCRMVWVEFFWLIILGFLELVIVDMIIG